MDCTATRACPSCAVLFAASRVNPTCGSSPAKTPDRAVSTTADIIRSFSKAVPLRPKLGFFVRRLLGNSEAVADLSPQGASAMGARHGLARWHTAPDRARELPQRLALGLPPRLHSFPRFLRASGIGAGPALDIGSVDDPAQTPGTANDRVARGAQRFCDLGSGASCGLQRQQPFVTRWRPTRLHGGRGPITMPHARHLTL
jgi:hypothetical protein